MLGYELLSEPKPNNEPLLIELPSATFAQNALLCVRAFLFAFTCIVTPILTVVPTLHFLAISNHVLPKGC
jgi:hypothetical protein